MIIVHVDSEAKAQELNNHVNSGKDVFMLIYMVGCGPCNATRPEWSKIESALKNQYSKNNKLVIVDINKDYISKVNHIGTIDGFPTIKYIGNYGKTVEQYEKSSITKKDRSINSFINWIESKISNTVSTTPTSSVQHVYKRILKTVHKTRAKNNKTRRNKGRHNKSKPKGRKLTRKNY